MNNISKVAEIHERSGIGDYEATTADVLAILAAMKTTPAVIVTTDRKNAAHAREVGYRAAVKKAGAANQYTVIRRGKAIIFIRSELISN